MLYVPLTYDCLCELTLVFSPSRLREAVVAAATLI